MVGPEAGRAFYGFLHMVRGNNEPSAEVRWEAAQVELAALGKAGECRLGRAEITIGIATPRVFRWMVGN